jgi:peptide/nickel transport system substrate-binding protein
MRKCLYGAVALVLALVVAGCGASKGQSQNTASNGGAGSSKSYAELRWGTYSFGSKLEWRKELGVAVASIEGLAVRGLVAYEPNGKLKLDLASSIENPNATTYVYHLRSGVKFSDGRTLTAADVVYSMNLNLGKESAVRAYWEDVSSVSAHGDLTVVVKLKRPNALWPEYLATTDQIVEKAAAEKVGGEKVLGTPSGVPIGTGPWKIDSFTPDVGVTLSRNPYWTGPPQPAAKIDIVDFKTEAAEALALRSGAIDGACFYSTPKLFLNIPGVRELTAPGLSLTMVEMNTTTPPFNNVHVRRAIAYAADVKGMIKALFPAGYASEDTTYAPRASFTGIGSANQISEMLGMLPKYSFDLVAAKRELSKSAYPHGFTTTLQVGAGDSVELGVAEVLVSDLAKIGITVDIHQFTSNEFPNMFAGKFTMWLQNYTSVYSDPEAVFSLMLSPSQINPPGSGLNGARFNNAEVTKLLTAQREALNPAARLRLIGKLLRIAGAEAPYVALLTPDAYTALSDKYVYPAFSSWTNLYGSFAMDVKLAK